MRWGIIGSGRIARVFAAALRAAGPPNALVCVACRAGGKIETPGDFFGAATVSGYDELLADRRVDVVYVATPHSCHREWVEAALGAGKHVLCEKPIGVSAADAIAMAEAADRADRFLGEAFMYRFGPLTRALVDLIQAGPVGRISLAEAGLGNRIVRTPESRLFDPARGGGAILDLGGYPMSIMRLVAGVRTGRPFTDPVAVAGAAVFGPTGVDETAAATLSFDDGFIAQVRCSLIVAQENVLRMWGEEGVVTVTSPFFAGIPSRPEGRIVVARHDGSTRDHSFADAPSPFVAEIRAVVDAIAAGRREPDWPALAWDDTIGNMRALDRWRDAVRRSPDE